MRAMSKTIGEIFYTYLHTHQERGEGKGLDHLRHAEQAAYVATQAGASDPLIAAALLHGIGRLLTASQSEDGMDQYEKSGVNYLRNLFPASVYEPVRLHKQAGRYLCTAVDSEEAQRFRSEQYWEEAVLLHKWIDEASQFLDFQIPPITGYRKVLENVALKDGASA